jgi:ubiquinone/menaquinone biosynthesis C-methylase UbiE
MSAHVEPVQGAAAYFDERAPWYDRHYDLSGPGGYALRTRMAAVCVALGPARGTVLDAGMGGGRLCAKLAATGWRTSGVDVAPQMVALARSRLPEAADRLVAGRLEELPFPSASFDAAVATGSLEYSDVPRSIAELSRVLRPGGRAVVTYPNPYAFYAIWKTRVYYTLVRCLKRVLRRPHPELPRGFGVLPPRRFLRLLTEHGFAVESVTYTSYSPLLTPFDVLLPRISAALAGRLERRQLGATLFSTQVVYSARKSA